MAELQIDYSEVFTPPTVRSDDEWDPPRHVYFGKKKPNGKMEQEPVYVHQEYPRTVYARFGEGIRAKLIHSAEQFEKLPSAEGWTKNLGSLGYIGAPSREQILEMQREEEDAAALAAAAAEQPKATLGLPKKA